VSRCLTAWNIHIDGDADEPAQHLEAG
jgi:hypothetical protein